ncbi:hypothetical protein T265_03009 [Opisthorchis viverrini]|uniref:Uncharacterized protein n=1 Tax=Opisthorchis viverrini TaxID=6198 RepID=A0A074ZTS3_OPIVI|nr:hypothetical protein T265_03009 [Opisthorchis viverrini]KER30521.1 hypothetical protein T265_03009 [Opisthorchis viverrini]
MEQSMTNHNCRARVLGVGNSAENLMRCLRSVYLCMFCTIGIVCTSFSVSKSPYSTEGATQWLSVSMLVTAIIALMSFVATLLFALGTLLFPLVNRTYGVVVIIFGCLIVFFASVSYGLLLGYNHHHVTGSSGKSVASPTVGEWTFASAALGTGLLTIGLVTLSSDDNMLDI